MDWLAPLDDYCERLGPGLFAEPLNLVSNLGFIIAGIMCIRPIRHTHFRSQRPGSLLLAILMLTIGVGSALFHSIANVWSMWADVLPITAFVFVYLWLFLRHTVGANLINTLLTVASFILLSVGVAKLSNPAVANGGEAYFGTWITLFGISCFYAGRKQLNNQIRMVTAAALFACSIFFRTIDPVICGTFPHGTHMFWHLINSVVLYLAGISYISERGKT